MMRGTRTGLAGEIPSATQHFTIASHYSGLSREALDAWLLSLTHVVILDSLVI
jgi:hypothetical protein